MNDNIIYDSGYISLVIQLIVGIIGCVGIFIPLLEKDKILTDIMIMETAVQFIEFMFYLWLVFSIAARSVNVTAIRYFDWFITTPIMLISTILYMEYENNKIKKTYDKVTIQNIYNKHKDTIIKIIIFNFFMLLFGYLGETNTISKYYSIFIGFIFFFLSFYTIWIHFATHSNISSNLFIFLFITWILYGFAAILPTIPKNISYNILDIIAKNFYGLFIVYKIIEINKSYKN